MNMAKAIVAFGEDWGGLPSSTQHIIGRLAQDRDVVWVNSIGMRRPRLNARDIKRVVAKIGSAFAGRKVREAAKMPERLSVLHPRVISWPGNPFADLANRHTLGGQLRETIAARGLEKPIFWTSLPTAESLIGSFDHGPVVYYCGDDFSALAGVDHGPVAAQERALAERADLILVASETLAQKFPASRTVVVPHGVDFDQFSTPAPRADDLPSSGPVAGFYGSLADWIDVDLIARCARAMPDWTFVLIGKVETDISALSGLRNVQLLGPRSHKELPSYVQHWDVSLLPFRDNPQIRACNPLKLREYFAAGTPVAASVDFPALAPYRDLLRLAEGQHDFAACIRFATSDGETSPARRARVAAESWDVRAQTVASLLERL
jgi:glycosyltransferase involved in cell wall biosynthesis